MTTRAPEPVLSAVRCGRVLYQARATWSELGRCWVARLTRGQGAKLVATGDTLEQALAELEAAIDAARRG